MLACLAVQAGQATSMDTPTSTARDAVGPSEGPQGFNEYPTDSTPSQSIDSEGGGQEAEGATARFTTPSGVVSSPPGSGGGDTSAASSAGGASASSPSEGGSEGGSGDPEGQPPAERVEEEQPGREQGSGTTSTTSPGQSSSRQLADSLYWEFCPALVLGTFPLPIDAAGMAAGAPC